MMSLMVLAICTLPPLAILMVAVTGLGTGRYSVALPLLVSAGVLVMLLLSPVLKAPDQTSGLRSAPHAQIGATYASLHISR